MADKLREISYGLQAMGVFRTLLADPVVKAFSDLLLCGAGADEEKLRAWGRFTGVLYENGADLSAYIRSLVIESENPYVKLAAAGKDVPAPVEKAFHDELAILNAAARLTDTEVREWLGLSRDLCLGGWENAEADLEDAYARRMADISRAGYGICSKYRAFSVEDGRLVPVLFPDSQKLSDLIGYEREREKVIANTEALLAGLPSNNVLLYGDAGTGKSSTVKAIANEYADRGLRLIEVKKEQFYEIPKILGRLAEDPLKFILFIDDLSFSSDDEDFTALKAILEGSVAGSSDNVAVYATSNRRHLIRENAADRAANDLHAFDTLQESMSLSARFGLTVTFQRPKKDLYLDIVRALAEESGIDMEDGALCTEAEAYAIRNGGRSPRAAKNFVTGLKTEGPRTGPGESQDDKEVYHG